MPEAADGFVLDRRALLAGAIALVGGAMAGFPAEPRRSTSSNMSR
jgi:hypothetical protein